MGYIRVTKEFSFEMAHTLVGYDGVCSEIHGHSYRLFVTVAGTPSQDESDPKFGMVMDFGLLKKLVSELILNVYDHALLIRRTETGKELTDILSKNFRKLQVVDFQPTCENLILNFVNLLEGNIPENVILHSIRLHETATSYAEWFADDKDL